MSVHDVNRASRRCNSYIVSQILGAYCACLLVYLQYGDIIKVRAQRSAVHCSHSLTKELLQQVETSLSAAGTLESTLFTPSGPAGVFAIYLAPGTSLWRVFLNEFVCVSSCSIHSPWHRRCNSLVLTHPPLKLKDFLIGLVIWAVDDQSNFTVSPVVVPWIIGLVLYVSPPPLSCPFPPVPAPYPRRFWPILTYV